MDQFLKRFAVKVVAWHLLALVLIVGVVLIASRQVYRHTRQQILDESRKRQELLAGQTARAIEEFYRSISANLDLLYRVEGERDGFLSSRATPLTFGPLMWRQLEGRATHLMVVGRNAEGFRVFGMAEGATPPEQLIEAARSFIMGVERPDVSNVLTIDSARYTIVAVPIAGPRGGAPAVLMAVVDPATVEERFLRPLGHTRRVMAALVDGAGEILAAASPELVGTNLHWDLSPRLARLAESQRQAAVVSTEVVDRAEWVKDRMVPPHMVSFEPMSIGQARWSLSVTSPLSDVDQMVSSVFREAFWWAAFIITAATALLVSTSTRLIRNQARLERATLDLLNRELEEARKIQLAWLPDAFGRTSHLDIAAFNRPALHISGDFYNWFALPDGRLAVVIGDVTGHGMSAAFLMSTTQMLVRTTLARVGDPGRALSEVNRSLCVQAFSGQFVTMLAMVVDPASGQIELANAGHPSPLAGQGGTWRRLGIDSELVLGVDASTRYPTQRIQLTPGTTLLLFTDGLCDVASPDESNRLNESGVIDRLLGHDDNQPQKTLETLIAAVDAFRGGAVASDDITAVAVRFLSRGADDSDARDQRADQVSLAGAV